MPTHEYEAKTLRISTSGNKTNSWLHFTLSLYLYVPVIMKKNCPLPTKVQGFESKIYYQNIRILLTAFYYKSTNIGSYLSGIFFHTTIGKNMKNVKKLLVPAPFYC